MKRLKADSSLCQGCHACEIACAKAWNKDEDVRKSALRVLQNQDGSYHINVCDQCGTCQNMCAAIALARDKNGVVRLDKKKCVGCLVCVGECVRDYMFYHEDVLTPFKCVACGICVKACPTGALAIVDEEE